MTHEPKGSGGLRLSLVCQKRSPLNSPPVFSLHSIIIIVTIAQFQMLLVSLIALKTLSTACILELLLHASLKESWYPTLAFHQLVPIS